MNRTAQLPRVLDCGIVAVVRSPDSHRLVDVAKALAAGWVMVMEITFTVPGMGDRQGWFFPGLVGAPTIILLHGYESSRGELLTLVSALQDHQYNAFVFDFAAHGANAGLTTFGYREADEVRAAIDTLAKRNDVDPTRFGIWACHLSLV